MRKLLLAGILFFSALSFGQIEEIRRITGQLCSPEFHGRGYVNMGDSIAAAFIAGEFQKMGVAPLEDSYFQPFSFNVNTFPGRMSVSQNGRTLIPGKEFVVDPASGGTPRKAYRTMEIPTDRVMDVEFIRSKIGEVMTNLHEGKPTALLFDLTLLSGDTLKQVRGFIPEIATVAPVIELVDTKFTWSVSQEQFAPIHLQIMADAFDKEAMTEIEIEAKLVENHHTQNVVAYLPASKKCSKTIVFSAHYDHLGRMGSDTYFPGANDNASGTAMLLTMANYFKQHGCDYNLIFIAFAGEEAGLVGSHYFVEHPLIKLNKIDFLVNLDIMGSGEEGITVVNATLFEKQFELLQAINTEKDLLVKVKKRGPAANSDHYWFTEKGVPAFFIYTMGPNKHYHDVFDTYEELSFNEYDDITTLLIEFVKRLKD